MTNKELLDKYVNTCIELDQEKMQYVSWRTVEEAIQKVESFGIKHITTTGGEPLMEENKEWMNNNWWYTGEPIDGNDDPEYVVRCYFEDDYQIRICEYCQPTHVFRDVYTEDVFELDKVIAWHRIEP